MVVNSKFDRDSGLGFCDVDRFNANAKSVKLIDDK